MQIFPAFWCYSCIRCCSIERRGTSLFRFDLPFSRLHHQMGLTSWENSYGQYCTLNDGNQMSWSSVWSYFFVHFLSIIEQWHEWFLCLTFTALRCKRKFWSDIIHFFNIIYKPFASLRGARCKLVKGALLSSCHVHCW